MYISVVSWGVRVVQNNKISYILVVHTVNTCIDIILIKAT